MTDRKVRVGQVWKQDETGENYLVTRIFTEGLATYAMLRKAGAEEEPRIRVRVEREGQRLPGYSYALDSEES